MLREFSPWLLFPAPAWCFQQPVICANKKIVAGENSRPRRKKYFQKHLVSNFKVTYICVTQKLLIYLGNLKVTQYEKRN